MTGENTMKDDCNTEAIIRERDMYRDAMERLLFARGQGAQAD
jgi:hypothetical protein